MNIKSDNFKCYIEGVRLPLLSFREVLDKNTLKKLEVDVPLGNIDPLMWANAYLVITVVIDNKECLLLQGLCCELDVLEDIGVLRIMVQSLYDIFNFNSTLDYNSPKRYGLANTDNGMVIYVGTDTDAVLDQSDLASSYKLSERYLIMNEGQDSIFDMKTGDPETYKLFYIINRSPLAELYIFNLFEQIDFNNFLLSRSFIDRFNLLHKSTSKRRFDKFTKSLQTTLDNTTKMSTLVDNSQG